MDEVNAIESEKETSDAEVEESSDSDESFEPENDSTHSWAEVMGLSD